MRYHDGEKVHTLPSNWWSPVTDREWEEALEAEFAPRGFVPPVEEARRMKAQLAATQDWYR